MGESGQAGSGLVTGQMGYSDLPINLGKGKKDLLEQYITST